MGPGAGDGTFRFVTAASLRRRGEWFVRMRWGAVAGAAMVAGVAGWGWGVPLPGRALAATLALLLAANVLYARRHRREPPRDLARESAWLKVQMVVDLLALTALLHFSGGIENPLTLLYVVHVIIAGLLFRRRGLLRIALLAGLLQTGLAVGEFAGWLPHYHVGAGGPAAHSAGYVALHLLVFWGVLAVCTAMTYSVMSQHREIGRELQAEHQRLLEADRAKMDFFRYVTHELKNPVITAQSALEAVLQIEGPRLPANVRDMLERARARLAQATDIVKDLADLTRGRLSARDERAPVDLVRVVEEVLAGQSDLIAARGLVVEKDLPAAPLVLETSATAVEKIVLNLVSNAVRYNRDGGRLAVALRDAGDAVELTVADEGIGIPPAQQEKVFDEFYRTPEAKRVSALGTGLGLPIVKRFTEQLGGTITLRSTPGEGTTFRVRLPRRPPEEAGTDPRPGDGDD